MDFYLTALLQGLCLSVIAIGIYISMKIFNIPDITTDGSYTLGGVVTGIMLSHQLPISLIISLVILAGAGAGTLTGLIHTKLKINPLLSGILVMTALYSINLTLLGRSNLPLLNLKNLFTSIVLFTDPNQNTLWIVLLFIILIAFVIGYVLQTDFGIAMRATGNSETMIRSLGVNTDRMKIIGLAISNSLVALSGFLMSQFQGFVDINMGIGIVIVGLGSVIIGETLINWLKITSVWLTIILVILGSIIFQLVLAFTLSMGIDANLLKLVTAAFVLIIVSLPRISLSKAS